MNLKLKNRTTNFSLVELLIVLSILLVLVSLLQPSLKKALSQADGIACLKNLKDMGAAQLMYAGDHDYYVTPGCMYFEKSLLGPEAFGKKRLTQLAMKLLLPFLGMII
jgi:type II secretory pathway pseudopilin PulG